MKRVVRPLVIAALSLGFVQSMHPAKQKVFASKADNPAREVEVKIIGWNQGQPISSSKFKKNTTGLLTSALYFDFDRGYQKDGNLWNKIQAQYTDGQGPEFATLEVFSAPKDAKIKLESGKIRLVAKNGQDVPQVPGEPETLKATITQIPTGQLLIISGDYTLDKKKVDSQAAKAHGVLDSVEYNDGQGGPIKIFKDRLTKIYVKTPSGDSVITGLHALDIKKSGDKPILIIDENGRARVSDKQPAAKKSEPGRSQQGQQVPADGESSDIPWLEDLLEQREKNQISLVLIKKDNAKLKGLEYKSANLWQAELPGANLEGAQLRNVKLGYANLAGANLKGANLSQQESSATHGKSSGNRALRNVNLTNADLTGANLSNANCYNAIFTGAILTNANVAGADFTDVSITEEQKQSVRGWNPTKVAKAEDPALEAERNARAKLESYIKTGRLPLAVALKTLLTSESKADYISKRDRLISDKGFVQDLMSQKLAPYLHNSLPGAKYTDESVPFINKVYLERSNQYYSYPSLMEEVKKKLEAAQPLYKELYDVLCNNAPMDAAAEQKIQKLYRAIYSL